MKLVQGEKAQPDPHIRCTTL